MNCRTRARGTASVLAMFAGISLLAPAIVLAKSGAVKPGHAKPRPAKPIPGGASQVEGLSGKVGDVLFDGHWRFQVIDVKTGLDSYALNVPISEQDYAKFHDVAEFDNATHTFTPKEGYKLVAIKCHVKNGQKNTEQVDGYLGNPKTALADDQENSYPPIAYDMYSKGAWITKELLPGSGEDLTLLFAVPPTAKMKDLVFTLKNWSDNNGRNVRVSLAP